METKELKKLNKKIRFVTSNLDAVIDDYFEYGKNAEAARLAGVYEKLAEAWHNMDMALDDLYFEIKGREEKDEPAGTDPDEPEPEPVLNDEIFRSLLRALTPETAKKNLQAAQEIFEWAEKIRNLDSDLIPTFAAMMLIEYGKLASKKEPAHAADQEGKEEG